MPYEDTDWTTADDTAKDTAQHFFTDTEGAHVTENADTQNPGNNVLIDSSGMYVRDGTTNLAQFTDPVIVGRTDGSNQNIRIGNIPNWGAGIGIFRGYANGLLLQGTANGGNMSSSQGAYIIMSDSVGVNTIGNTPYTILDTDKQSDFAIGGVHVYGGSTVKTVPASREITVFSNAEVRSMFHVASGDEKEIGITITNGDYGAQAHRITSVSYRSNSGWNVYLDGNASAGAFRFNYIAIVPDAKSTI